LDKFQILYRDLDQIQEQSFARFNYRERMKLERTLFILLNEILSFPLKSFSEVTKKQVIEELQNNKENKYFISLVDKIFSLRFLIKALSSGNPYEKYDALFANEYDRLNVFKFIRKRIENIEQLYKIL